MLDYIFTVANLMAIYCILALGLNVISGYAGQFHLGIATYMGMGAYATAVLTKWAGWPLILSLLLSTLLAGLIAGATGVFALRVKEDTLTVITIALAFVFESLLINLPYLGGAIGIPGIPRPQSLASPSTFFIMAVSLLFVSVLANRWVAHSWLGMAWQCIREDEEAGQAVGVNPGKFKILAFSIGGAFAGLSGVLYAHMMTYVSPVDFGFLPSVFALAMVVFGGLGTLRGPLFGAAFLTAMPELFRFVQDYRNLIYGGLLVVMMLWRPNGLLGGKGSLLPKYIRRREVGRSG